MAKKTLLFILSILIMLTAINSTALYFFYRQSKHTVVIDIIRVVNEFKLKKDLERKVAVKLNDLATAIDSSKAVYRALVTKHAKEEIVMHAAAEIDTLQSSAQRAYTLSNKTINEQIWQRLNTLINEYGDKYGYVLVIGANGMGTVLYNKKDLDKTEELISFINDKYELGH